jgi:hypothetical protein
MNTHPDQAHKQRTLRDGTLDRAHYEAAVDWAQAVHEQDGFLKLANLLQDLAEAADLGAPMSTGLVDAEQRETLTREDGTEDALIVFSNGELELRLHWTVNTGLSTAELANEAAFYILDQYGADPRDWASRVEVVR